jgi:hypothetical protein
VEPLCHTAHIWLINLYANERACLPRDGSSESPRHVSHMRPSESRCSWCFLRTEVLFSERIHALHRREKRPAGTYRGMIHVPRGFALMDPSLEEGYYVHGNSNVELTGLRRKRTRNRSWCISYNQHITGRCSIGIEWKAYSFSTAVRRGGSNWWIYIYECSRTPWLSLHILKYTQCK